MIGPGEIEESLMKHEAVALVCVLGAPDPVRGQVTKVFIVLRGGFRPDRLLEESIRKHVKGEPDAHSYSICSSIGRTASTGQGA